MALKSGANSIYFEDINIGSQRISTGRTIGEADILIHAGQTGDFFPHHMDAEWMKSQPAKQRIAHGTLVMSIAVGLTAIDINIESISYGYDRVRFVKPVFIGDTVTSVSKIVEKRDHEKRSDVGFVFEELKLFNQHESVVLSLIHVYLVNKRHR